MEELIPKPLYRKVLVIDDSETDRYIANRILQKNHFSSEIILKESALKGIEYLLSLNDQIDQLPDLIFLDIRMPEMDGFGFLAEYEKLPQSIKTNCVIMMLSTSLNPEDLHKAESSPYVNRYLNKPLNKEKLESLEQDFLNRNK